VAISTYAELQTAVGNWLGRTDLTLRLPEFIALVEPKIRRKLRDRTERLETVTVLGQEYITLASDVKEVSSISLSDETFTYPLRQVTPATLSRLARAGTGRPVAYTVLDGRAYFDVTPDAVYDLVMTYLEAIPALSGSQTTNTVLTRSPDIYLYGSMIEAEPYLEHDERVALWKGMFEEAINDENIHRERQELGAQPEQELPMVFGADDGY
jgi:hypothetical protein